jgi:hypothetical protein
MTTIASAVGVGDAPGASVADTLGAGVGLALGVVELLLQPPVATSAKMNASEAQSIAARTAGEIDNFKTDAS